MGLGHQDAQVEWQYVAEHVLNRMSVDSGHSDWRSPLVVLLVDQLVEELVVEQPVTIVEGYLGAQDADWNRVGDLAYRRQCSHIRNTVRHCGYRVTHHKGRRSDQDQVDEGRFDQL